MAMYIKSSESQELSIVLIGDFNPKIYHPSWFAAHNLIKQSDSDSANIKMIQHDINIFNLEWLRLEVLPDRFVVRTSQEPYFEIVRDLIIGTFSILEHTPVVMMGINIKASFRMRSKQEWTDTENIIAPKELWLKSLNNPTLEEITIREPERKDGLVGYVRITLGKSSETQDGFYISINDHYEVKDKKSILGCIELIEILKAQWNSSIKKSEEIINSFLKG